MHGGLEKAADPLLGWSNEYRTIIHIADAPGHGTRLYDPADAPWMGDLEPNYDQDGSQLAALLLKLRVDVKVRRIVSQSMDHLTVTDHLNSLTSRPKFNLTVQLTCSKLWTSNLISALCDCR